MLTLSSRTRQAIAVGILLSVVFIGWQCAIWPVLEMPLSREAQIADLSREWQFLSSMESQEPLLRRREQQATNELTALRVSWSGRSEIEIAAAIQDVIGTAAQQSGATVTSASMLPHTAGSDAATLSTRARVEGSVNALQTVMAAIDRARPRLFVDNLTVTTISPDTPERPQQLSFEFTVTGYLASAFHAH